jgi:holo-[acyl-carrier protein] synthase
VTTRRTGGARASRRAAPPGGAGERVLAVGIDLVESDRVRRAIETWGDRFVGRVFRTDECAYCNRQAAPWRHFAGRFAVKEAVAKAFGTGIGDSLGWKDVEVARNDRTGAPAVTLHGRGRRLAARRGVTRVLVSLAHGRDLAIAQATLVGGEVRDAKRQGSGKS